MITDIEQKFYSTFGIDAPYPPITDKIYLELICLTNATIYSESDILDTKAKELYELVYGNFKDLKLKDLKNTILKNSILTYLEKENRLIKEKVKSLFKEEVNEV